MPFPLEMRLALAVRFEPAKPHNPSCPLGRQFHTRPIAAAQLFRKQPRAIPPIFRSRLVRAPVGYLDQTLGHRNGLPCLAIRLGKTLDLGLLAISIQIELKQGFHGITPAAPAPTEN